MCPRVFFSEVSLAAASPSRVRWWRRVVVAGPVNAADQAARDDAHLQSLGIKPELKRTLGFLSNFAIAFSYISVSTGTFTNYRASALRRRRSGDLLVLAHRHPRPDVRRAELRRAGQPLPGRRLDLPVVEAPVATRRSAGSPAGSTSGPGVLTVTAVAVTVAARSLVDDLSGDRSSPSPSPIPAPQTMLVFSRSCTLVIDHGHQRRSASDCCDHQQHRRRRRDPRHARVRA